MPDISKHGLKKAIHLSLITVLLGSLIGFSSVRPPARATADDYTVSGGDLASLPDVGATAATLNQIVITDADGDDVTNDPETIRVEINTTDYPSVVFDQSVTTFTIGGTCGFTGHNAVTYNSATQLDIPVTGGTSCAAGETITIDDIDVQTIYAQSAPGAAPLISIDNWTTSAGTPVDTSSTINLAVTAATTLTQDIDASAVTQVGDATGQVTMDITFPVALATGDTIKITFPDNWNVSTITTGAGQNVGLDNTVNVGVSGQVVTYTLEGSQGATAETMGFLSNTITPYYAATGQNIATLIEKSGGEDVVASAADTGVNEPIDDTTAADAAATVTLGTNSVVGAAGDTTLDITLPFAMGNTDTIDITFPASVDVSNVGSAVTGTLENTDSITCADAGSNVVTCTTSAATNTSGTVIMTGITTVYEDTTDITDVAVEAAGASGNDIAADTAVAMTDITPADASATLTLADPTVGATQNTTLILTSPVDLIGGDTIAFDAPANLNVSGATFVSTSFTGTGFTGCSGAGQTVTCIVDTDLTAGSGKNIVMSGITAGYAAAGQIITSVVVYNTVAGANIATDANGSSTDTTAADAAATVTLGTNSVVGAAGDTTVDLTLPFALDADDTIDITFPASFDISGVGSAVTGTLESTDSITCADAGGQVVTCTTSAATNTSGTIIMTGITTLYEDTTDVTWVQAEDEGVAANDIATDNTVATTDITPADAAASLTLADPTIGATQDTTLNITLPLGIDNTDTVVFTAPANLDVSAAAFDSDTFTGAGSFACSAAAQVVTCTANGVIDAGPGTIVMTGITAAFGATGQTITSVAVTDTGNGDIATDASGSVTDTVAATLTNVALSLSDYHQSTLATATVSITLVGNLPADGKVRVTFPAGFKVNGADNLATPTNIDGTFTTGDAGQIVTIARVGDGTMTTTGTNIELPIQYVVNPFATGTTGTFTFETLTSGDAVIADATVSPVFINPLESTNTQPGGGGGGGGGNVGFAGSYLAQLNSEEAQTGTEEAKTEETTKTQETTKTEATQQPAEEGQGAVKESAPTYSDTAGHWAKTYIDQASELGIVKGESDTIFAPDKAITGQELIDAAKNAFDVDLSVDPGSAVTRAEALKALVEAVVTEDLDTHFAENYTSKEGYWYAAFVDVLLGDADAKYVAFGADMDIVDGYGDGTFGPDNKMTKAELAKIVIKLLDYQSAHQ